VGANVAAEGAEGGGGAGSGTAVGAEVALRSELEVVKRARDTALQKRDDATRHRPSGTRRRLS